MLFQKKDKKKRENPEQWEQWKAKDSELVEGNYEQDLHNAILLSKLDYEEKKHIYKQNKKDTEEKNMKKKKNKAMTLEQFNTLVSEGETKNKGDTNEVDNDAQFFDRINATAKEVITTEKKNEKVNKKPKEVKTFNDETITIAQLREKLEYQVAQNDRLKEELNKSKQEILAVKDRNKILCGILAHGESKS